MNRTRVHDTVTQWHMTRTGKKREAKIYYYRTVHVAPSCMCVYVPAAMTTISRTTTAAESFPREGSISWASCMRLYEWIISEWKPSASEPVLAWQYIYHIIRRDRRYILILIKEFSQNLSRTMELLTDALWPLKKTFNFRQTSITK